MVTLLKNKWLDLVNPDEVDLYPLQFANSERLNYNDVVYLFDEVGCGKTISSGIMALEYLEQNPEKEVLVITTNALAQPTGVNGYGQFQADWFNKLPFRELKYANKIKVVNNHYSNLESKKHPKQYGLVIIDEAHLFLTKDTKRYNNLVQNIRADKVVFLTATPIKDNERDLYIYPKIASEMIGKSISSDWIKDLSTYGKKPDELICSQFDITYPVTRYFKDTTKSLNKAGFDKIKVKRNKVVLWNYQSRENKNEVLAEKVRDLYNESSENRFVIFTRFVEREAVKIGVYLRESGFIESKVEIEGTPTYYIVTGINSEDLSSFSKKKNLPTVLILTYQIAEQGVNLPGYNHVVNYHISSYPSALEQRFGRVDRMDSEHKTITNCFLISGNPNYYFDTNTANFVQATWTTLNSLLTYLPSRNTIISPESIERLVHLSGLYQNYQEKMLSYLQDDSLIADLYNILWSTNEEQNFESFTDESILEITDERLQELKYFCDEHITLDVDLDNEKERKARLIEDIRMALKELENQISHENSPEKIKIIQLLAQESTIWDNIFYIKNHKFFEENWSIKSDLSYINAVDDCGFLISTNSRYKEYVNSFNENIRIPLLFEKYRKPINDFLEKSFENNAFGSIFPETVGSSYEQVFSKIDQFKDMDDVIVKELERLILSTPFFKMCEEFKLGLFRLAFTEDFVTREKFNGNVHVFASAMGSLARKNLDVSSGFYEKYFGHIANKSICVYLEEFGNFFTLYFQDSNDPTPVKVGVASNWLKLAYHLTRKESYVCILKRNSCCNLYFYRIYDTSKGEYVNSEYHIQVPLFDYFIHRNSSGLRTWVTRHLVENVPSADWVWANDYWTKGIQNAIYHKNFQL